MLADKKPSNRLCQQSAAVTMPNRPFIFTNDWFSLMWQFGKCLPLSAASYLVWSPPIDPGLWIVRAFIIITVLVVVVDIVIKRSSVQVQSMKGIVSDRLTRLWTAGCIAFGFGAVWIGMRSVVESDYQTGVLIGSTLGIVLLLLAIWSIYHRIMLGQRPVGSVCLGRAGSRTLNGEQERRRTAIHELGHWMVAATGPLGKSGVVTIIPSETSSGHFEWMAPDQTDVEWHRWRRTVHLGGRAAIAVVDPAQQATGCSGDWEIWEIEGRDALSQDPRVPWFATPQNSHEAASNAISLAQLREKDFSAALAIIAANRIILERLVPILLERKTLNEVDLMTWRAQLVDPAAKNDINDATVMNNT